MKNIILISVSVLFFSISLIGQSKYNAGMEKAFSLISEHKFSEAVAMFERIAQVEKDNWIPAFHAAHTLIWTSFAVDDKDTRESMLEQAKESIKMARLRSADNADIYSLEAMLYTSYMAFDPATYGMMYAGKIETLHNTAYDLDPNNPRVISGKIQYAHGKASFFGQDLRPFCEEMKKIIPKFNSEKVTIPFAPNHGLIEAKAFIQNCNE